MGLSFPGPRNAAAFPSLLPSPPGLEKEEETGLALRDHWSGRPCRRKSRHPPSQSIGRKQLMGVGKASEGESDGGASDGGGRASATGSDGFFRGRHAMVAAVAAVGRWRRQQRLRSPAALRIAGDKSFLSFST
jgi:hypothetical protein